ncbi:hypothetical protein EB796_023473 [Bugula neritina]|uniref:Uncharacterized protein n=1 Tax=Bugula neritina TaxID=10212 RepID=A0A7J7IWF6_BUGNE|nr:hypothetical protein EB796_023473 [Bugula neritina]
MPLPPSHLPCYKTQSEITQIGSSEKGNKSTESGISGVELKEDVCTSVLLKLKEQMKKVYKERQKHLQSGKKRKYEMSCTSEMHLPLHTVNMKPEESENAVQTKSNQTVS